jgi:hypothetical protein
MCTQLIEIGIHLMMLWLSFDGKPCPFEWGVISETICDLANTILLSDDWDTGKLSAQNQHLVPEHKPLEPNVPFAAGAKLIVVIPVDPQGTHDIYIDDIIGLTVDIPGSNNVARGQAAALLAIDATARPNHPNEPILHESMYAIDKLKAEAGLSEKKMILGWSFDF